MCNIQRENYKVTFIELILNFSLCDTVRDLINLLCRQNYFYSFLSITLKILYEIHDTLIHIESTKIYLQFNN